MVEHYITHNGDLDFFRVAGQWHELGKVQVWLEKVLECPMPATVDSACIAGLVDLHRTAGCWGLSVRYAYQCGLATALGPEDTGAQPTYAQYEQCGEQFARALDGILEEGDDFLTVLAVGENKKHRKELAKQSPITCKGRGPLYMHTRRTTSRQTRSSNSVQAAVNAFFDNDLMQTTRLVLNSSKGSFGLCITSSMDAHRQLCVAARGQTMSVAFYPESGLICYGSELAVKAGLGKKAPNGSSRVAAASAEATARTARTAATCAAKDPSSVSVG